MIRPGGRQAPEAARLCTAVPRGRGRDHILGEAVPCLPAAVHAVPAVRGSLQSAPGARAGGWPAGDFVFVAK